MCQQLTDAVFMDGLNESIEDVIPDKYQAITNDNADYFVQGDQNEQLT